MKALRSAHVAGILLSGIALAAVLHDAPRVAAAALVLVCLIQFWSLEVLCSAFTAKIERKRS